MRCVQRVVVKLKEGEDRIALRRLSKEGQGEKGSWKAAVRLFSEGKTLWGGRKGKSAE